MMIVLRLKNRTYLMYFNEFINRAAGFKMFVSKVQLLLEKTDFPKSSQCLDIKWRMLIYKTRLVNEIWPQTVVNRKCTVPESISFHTSDYLNYS